MQCGWHITCLLHPSVSVATFTSLPIKILMKEADAVSALYSAPTMAYRVKSVSTCVHRWYYSVCHPTGTAQLRWQMSACIDEVVVLTNRLQPRPWSSGARWVDVKNKFHRPHWELVMSLVIPGHPGYFDSDTSSMKTHVSRMVSSCFAIQWQIRSIRRSVSHRFYSRGGVTGINWC